MSSAETNVIQQNLADYAKLLRDRADLTPEVVIQQMPQEGGAPIFSRRILQTVEEGNIPDSFAGAVSSSKLPDGAIFINELARVYRVSEEEKKVLAVLYGRRLIQLRRDDLGKGLQVDAQLQSIRPDIPPAIFKLLTTDKLIQQVVGADVDANAEIATLQAEVYLRRSRPTDENPQS